MRLLVTGGTGFVGRHLLERLLAEGHGIAALTRDPEAARARTGQAVDWFPWDALREPPPEAALHGVEGVVNLAGESLVDRRWTEKQKSRIRESRIAGTRRLMEALALRDGPAPGVAVSASAVGYYGNRGEERLTEASAPGEDFLATLCQEWEEAATATLPAETRVVTLRIGVVLGKGGGALARLVPLFRLGLGGPLASGKQWMSWIHVDDLCGLILHALRTPGLRGAVNATAPEPARNREFTHALGKALRRPAFLPVPGFALRLALGEMAEVLIGGQRVLPEKALDSGFAFRFPNVAEALGDVCGPHPRASVG